MPLFAQNARHQLGSNSIGRAVMKLSYADYLVLRTSTGKGETPSIEIDRPLEGQHHQVANHAGKLFGSTEYCGCRVYWEIKSEEVAA